MKIVIKVFNGFHNLVVTVAKILLLLMTIITCVQVFCRYVLKFSIGWSEEVPLIFMVWFGFISMAIGVKNKLHISIQVFYNLFPPKFQKIVDKFVDLVILLFGFIMIYYGGKLSSIMMTSTYPATKMPTGYLYMVIPISGILITFDSIMSLIGLNQLENK
ncbi:hypothetical protein AN1V17_42860 [Vallitalea sediminicola]